MKALTLERKLALQVVRGEVRGLFRKRSVPRQLIGYPIVIHAKASKDGPAMGVGKVTFGEAVPLKDGQCLWPLESFEEWGEVVLAPGAAGFWTWTHGEPSTVRF